MAKVATRKAVVPVKSMPPANLMKRMAKDKQRGLSSDQADNLVPLIYILQSQSPQVLKRNPSFIEGAEAGTIWLRNASEPLVDGEEGIDFQPCYFSKDWVEWIPRDSGGGFVARHQELPKDAERIEDKKNPNRVAYVRKNGNEIIETRYHVGFVLGRGRPMPFVIPLSSTGHSFSKQWMFMMNSKQLPGGEIPPSYSSIYHLTTRLRTNAMGEWFAWDVADAGWVEKEDDYNRGEALNQAFAAGAKEMETPEETRGENDDM